MATKSFPTSAFTFLAPASIGASDDPALAQTQRRFSGVAYSGELITDHGYWGNPIVFDLSTLSCETPAPLLEGHDPSDTIGVIESANISSNLTIAGRLFSDIDEDAASIAAKADAGFPWQMSVGIFPGSIEEVPAGMTASVNGRDFPGPLNIFKNSRVREVSIVALGADSLTSTRVFEQGDTVSIEIQEPVMAEQETQEIEQTNEEVQTTEEVVEQVNEGESPEVIELKAQLAAAKSELAAFLSAHRREKVESLFSSLNREFSDDSAAPYMSMTDAQFSAVSADLLAVKPQPKLSLFSASITGGESDDAPSMSNIAAEGLRQLSQGKK